ncbi:hypothetical protein KAREA_49010 [Prescottella equi]|nr:hypothetical protein KAREA_49010 [Prescottella equi]
MTLHPSAIAKIELRDVDRPRVIRLDEAQALAQVFGLRVDQMFESPMSVPRLAASIMDWLVRQDAWTDEGVWIGQQVEAAIAALPEDERAAAMSLLRPDLIQRVVDENLTGSAAAELYNVIGQRMHWVPDDDQA